MRHSPAGHVSASPLLAADTHDRTQAESEQHPHRVMHISGKRALALLQLKRQLPMNMQ